MQPLTEPEIRASFVNCSKGEVKRLRLPGDLDSRDWSDHDYLGWVDARSPHQAFIVAPTDQGLVGIKLRRNVGGTGRARMCSLCITTHPGSGVSLMVAPRAGNAGRDGNSIGLDICSDLTCSSYVRGLIPAPGLSHARETLRPEERVARLQLNVASFLGRVLRERRSA